MSNGTWYAFLPGTTDEEAVERARELFGWDEVEVIRDAATVQVREVEDERP